MIADDKYPGMDGIAVWFRRKRGNQINLHRKHYRCHQSAGRSSPIRRCGPGFATSLEGDSFAADLKRFQEESFEIFSVSLVDAFGNHFAVSDEKLQALSDK